MRASAAEYRSLPLRGHDLLRDVPLYDVSSVDLPGGGSGRTVADIRALEAETAPSHIATLLYGLRYFLGRVFGWDREPMRPEDSLLERLSERDRRDSEITPGTLQLDDYKIESENDVFFDRDSAVLKDEAKPALADLAKLAKSLQGYLIEISGYTSNALGSKTDQKLSEERAAAVARYFYEVQNIPMRRIHIPVGYGSTHPLASNANAEGRELNRRVDVKVLVNKSLEEGL
jgi:outer membrane protein OmpA-like peptidoglycan-associated protein